MKNWKTIEGWFTDSDNAANTQIASAVPENGIIVCLGVWYGRSLVALASELLKVEKPNVSIVAIDLYPKDSFGIASANLAEWKNMWICKSDVLEASKMFADGSLSAVFIDANHSYEPSLAILNAWIPKVASAGIIAGHDYQPNWPGVVQAVDETFQGQNIEVYGTSYLVRRS